MYVAQKIVTTLHKMPISQSCHPMNFLCTLVLKSFIDQLPPQHVQTMSTGPLNKFSKYLPHTTIMMLLSLSILRAIFPAEPGLASCTGAKDDGSGGDNWSYESCKAPVKSSPPTNQHPAFYRPDSLLVAQSTLSEP